MHFKLKIALIRALCCCFLRFSVAENHKCVFKGCELRCAGVVEQVSSVADYINKAIYDEKEKCDWTTLYILDSVFENFTLTTNWLTSVNQALKVQKLVLENCSISKIERGAFSKHPFAGLSILYITNSNLRMIKRDMFEGMGVLTILGIRNYIGTPELLAEEGSLNPIGTSITSIEFNSFTISADTLINLFGGNGTYMPFLEILDLRSNNIGRIPKNAFKNIFRVQSIFLGTSRIKTVDKDAFCQNAAIKQLQLSNNRLETLHPLIWQSLPSLKPHSLYLEGNSWKCDCKLQWLKDIYVTTDIINQQIPLLCSNGLSFNDADFCERTTYFDPLVYCTNEHPPSPKQIDVIHTVQININNKIVTLELQEFECEPLEVKLVIRNYTKELHNYYLVWFNSKNLSDYNYIRPIINGVIITSLAYETTYSFSVVKNNEIVTFPNASFGLTTSPHWHYRTWISNDYKTLVLTLTIIFTVLFGAISAFATYLCLRKNHQNPVETDTKNYEKPVYWEPYAKTSSAGYLTPKFNKHPNIQSSSTPTSNISEWKVYTTSSEYDECCENVDSSNATQYKKRIDEKWNNENRYEEFHPPLPPPKTLLCREL